MIDTALIETLSVLVGASTVVVGVILGLRELGEMKRQRNREFFDAVYRKFTEDRDFLSRRLEMLSWSWEDYDDFQKKYVGATNLESYATCWQVWTWYDSLGAMLQSGMVGGI